ncbi:glycosyltransferase [Candidatus Woesearchaeota archaeon]|nr:glycosyltransferase [Candidatus Woesearchaeota archaeon]
MQSQQQSQPFISIIIPAYNAEKYIALVLEAISNQDYPKEKLEVIVVDDNSTDKTVEIAKSYEKRFHNFKLLIKEGIKGAAKSTNMGIKEAKGEIVCSIDSDAILQNKNWLQEIVSHFEDKTVAAVAGYIATGNTYNIWARLMGAELEDRYDSILTENVDHVSTCNTAYRKSFIEKVNLFDENLYYGYDVDLSYKLKNAGFTIKLVKTVGCNHYWKETLLGYLKQQFNVAYGRLYLINRYPQKASGDKVAGMFQFVQVPMTFLIGFFLIFSLFSFSSVYIAVLFLILLLIMQLPQLWRIIKKKKDASYLLLPFLNIARNMTWCIALLSYYFDKMRGKTKIKIL